MRAGWTQDEYGFSRVLGEWLPLAVSPRNDGRSEWWAASIDGQRLVNRGEEARFKDADLAMQGVEDEALRRCERVLRDAGREVRL